MTPAWPSDWIAVSDAPQHDGGRGANGALHSLIAACIVSVRPCLLGQQDTAFGAMLSIIWDDRSCFYLATRADGSTSRTTCTSTG
jgi:hypothetical protein